MFQSRHEDAFACMKFLSFQLDIVRIRSMHQLSAASIWAFVAFKVPYMAKLQLLISQKS
jgi:hypothetical protein